MAGVQMGFVNGIAKAPFLAEIDLARCDYCGDCMGACNVKGIGLAADARGQPRVERFAGVGAQVCLDCGACIDACARGAIRLVPRPGPKRPPRTKGQMFARILWEKGRLWPFLTDRAQQSWRSLIRGRLDND